MLLLNTNVTYFCKKQHAIEMSNSECETEDEE